MKRDELSSSCKTKGLEAQAILTNLESKVKAFKTRHGSIDETDLPHKTDTLLADGKAIMKNFQQWQTNSGTVQEDGMAALAAQVAGGGATIGEFDAKVKKQVQTMQYLFTTKSSEGRAAYQSRRWRISKVEQGFVKGKFDGGMSSLLAKALIRIYEAGDAEGNDGKILVDPKCVAKIAINLKWEACDKAQPALWTKHENLPFDATLVNKHGGAYCTKAEELADAINENNRWKGAQGEVEQVNIDKDLGAIGEIEAMASPGGRPWVVAVRQYGKRLDQKSLPLPGYPSIYYAGSHSVVVAMAPIEGALEKGITLASMESFWGTADGDKYWEEKSVIFRLLAGQFCFVPAAWWPVITACPEELSNKKQDPAIMEAMPSAVVVSLLSKGLYDNAPTESMKAVKLANEQHLKAKAAGDLVMWQARNEMFQAFA